VNEISKLWYWKLQRIFSHAKTHHRHKCNWNLPPTPHVRFTARHSGVRITTMLFKYVGLHHIELWKTWRGSDHLGITGLDFYLSVALQPWLLSSSLILYTVGRTRTPWTSHQPVARPLHRYRLQDNIVKRTLKKESEDVDWINLEQHKDQWRALVTTVMNLRV
jgi:hypothetical protein